MRFAGWEYAVAGRTAIAKRVLMRFCMSFVRLEDGACLRDGGGWLKCVESLFRGVVLRLAHAYFGEDIGIVRQVLGGGGGLVVMWEGRDLE